MVSRSIKAILAFTLAAAFLGYEVPHAAAENAEPEKCTCDVLPEADQNNGAEVLNATACWLSQFDDLQWCDITVQSLEGEDGAHAAIVATLFGYDGDAADLELALHDEFERFVSTYQARPRDGVAFNIDKAREIVPALMKQNEEALVSCVIAFKEATRGFQSKTYGDFRCRVGQSTGWLRLEFRVGDMWLAYILAPNG